MWLVMSPQPKPDAIVWPGRRILAVVDAIAWPALLVLAIVSVQVETGLFGRVVIVLAALAAISRVRRAAFRNERYRFTTSRWASSVVWLLALGFAVSAAHWPVAP